MTSLSERIRQLNDAFRCSLHGGQVVLTQGVLSLPAEGQSALLEGVRRFNSFNADNNLYNEHDFGNLKHAGVTYFWKIDYYDQDLQFGSPDAADPNVTKRVMTLMRADEY